MVVKHCYILPHWKIIIFWAEIQIIIFQKKSHYQSHLFFILQHRQIIMVTERVAITAPPATTAMSQMGSLVFLPTSWDSFFPLSMIEESGVVLGSVGIVTTVGEITVITGDSVVVETVVYIN